MWEGLIGKCIIHLCVLSVNASCSQRRSEVGGFEEKGGRGAKQTYNQSRRGLTCATVGHSEWMSHGDHANWLGLWAPRWNCLDCLSTAVTVRRNGCFVIAENAIISFYADFSYLSCHVKGVRRYKYIDILCRDISISSFCVSYGSFSRCMPLRIMHGFAILIKDRI